MTNFVSFPVELLHTHLLTPEGELLAAGIIIINNVNCNVCAMLLDIMKSSIQDLCNINDTHKEDRT